MADRSYRDLRKLIDEPFDFHDIATFLTGIRSLSGRPAALIVTSQLNVALKRAILRSTPNLTKENQKNLFDDFKPLSGFYPQIWIGNALGVYGEKTLYDLEEIRHVRNAFAHSARPVDFDTPAIVSHCNKITLPERAPNVAPALFGLKFWPPHNAQERFIDSSLAYWEAFYDLASGRRSEWPLD